MSGKGNHGGKVSNGISAIPPGSRKVVQSLKDIVNCPESEIYAMLKDCDMDPNEAVNRLLTQDPFHEVKSKREKKKETKDTTDLRPRGANNVTHRGARSGSDRYGRGGSSQFRSTESSVVHGKPAYRKENGAHAYAGSTSYASATAGNNGGRRTELTRDSSGAENKAPTISAGDDFFAPAQPPSGVQSAWIGNPGQVSMADIVKMGKPQSNKSALPNHTANDRHGWAPPAHNDIHSSENCAPKVSEIRNEQEASASEHLYSNNEWPSTEQPSAASMSSFMEPPTVPDVYEKPSTLVSLDRENEHVRSEIDEVQSEEDDLDESPVGPSSVPNIQIQEDGNGGSSLLDNDLYENINSHESNGHAFECNDAEEGSSSMAASLQQLNLHTDAKVVPPEEHNPVVIIPNHLQVHAHDCPQLSFGSFGSAGISSGLSGPFASQSLSNNPEETSKPVEPPTAGHSDARDPEYYADDHLRNVAEDNLVHGININVGNYDSPSVPQPQVLKEETQEATQGNQYPFMSSTPGYNYDNNQHLDAALRSQQSSSQLQNIADFSSVMQAYSNSLPTALLASNLPTGRESDLPYSSFPTNQSMPTKYNTTASSVNGPSISMPEALRASSISTPQPTQQSLGGSAVAAMGHTLPQHLAVHPYSQTALPLAQYANMIGYPFLPQSYAYMPSAFQQAFPGNSTYHQSLAALLPQYKNSVSVSSLPQSAAVPSGYGGAPAGSSPHNQPAAPVGNTLRYEDVLNSQYKDTNHLMSLQQNENSAMWLQGHGSRTMSAAPTNSYYNFQGQNQPQQQPPSGFRQGQHQQQQPSQQHFSALGYPNYYHSQPGMSLEHQQQQNTRDGSMAAMQGQGAKQQTQQQLWQNSY